MGGVFANGLEISGKAVQAQTIAAMPDVCFTPPENPATPPGVPVPYPSFGMGSDTENGTGTVFIGGKTVNIKNKSDESRTSGTEAGCAAKKGVVTSKNTGKKYFNAWSNDVKFDGECVIRFGDLATHNHASPGGNAPPWPEVALANPAAFDCDKLGIKPYDQLKCPDGYDKEHTVEVQFFTVKGVRDLTLDCCKAYDEQKAPCICMKAQWTAADSDVKGKPMKSSSGKSFTLGDDFVGKRRGTPHYYKSADARNWLRNNEGGKLGDFKDTCVKSSAANVGMPPAVQDVITKCLEAANMKYLKESMNKSEEEVKEKKNCQSTCPKAQDQAQLVRNVKAKLKAALPPESPTPVISAKDVPASSKTC